MDSNTPNIKQENAEDDKLVIPDILLDAPAGFEQSEWATLTDGWADEQEEVEYWIQQRGQSKTRKGRPTNFKATFKGELSNSARAIHQRDKAAQRSIEEAALYNADASDRAAKYALTRRLDKDPQHQLLSAVEQQIVLDSKLEELVQGRFENRQSREWLESKLQSVHGKWRNIRKTVSRKQHEDALSKLVSKKGAKSSKSFPTRASQRVYGSGGVLEKIMRKVYQEGASKLETIDNKNAQSEWQEFVTSLSQEELAVVTDKDWQEREPTPPAEFIYEGDDILLEAHRSYVKGDNDDECEEEVDEDSDIEDWLNKQENEYETEEQYLAALESDSEDSEDDESEEDEMESEAEGNDVDMTDVE